MNCIKHRFASACIRLLGAGLLLTLALNSQAADTAAEATQTKDTRPDADIAYVDSIHKWGAWELDIEPAAGGVAQPAGQPLLARGGRIRLRTNSIAALAPTPPPAVKPPPGIPPQKPPVVTPPPIPTITPMSPNVPIPVGGPADAF